MNRGKIDIVTLGPRRDAVFGPRDDEMSIDDVVRHAEKILKEIRSMHYKNGREAKNGDKVVVLGEPQYKELPVVGILYDATAGNDFCNGKLAMTKPNDPCPNLNDCLHADDVRAALGDLSKVPNTSGV